MCPSSSSPAIADVDWVRSAARRAPERPAVAIDDGTSVTYQALDARVDVAAGDLLQSGVGPGDRVGVLAERRLATVTTLWAVWRIGAVAVVLDPDRPQPPPPSWELAAVVPSGDVSPPGARIPPGASSVAPPYLRAPGGRSPSNGGQKSTPVGSSERPPTSRLRKASAGRNLPPSGGTQSLRPQAPSPLRGDRREPSPLGGDRAEDHTWVPTTGSTGRPKAVVLTRGNVAAAVGASQQRLGNHAEDRWLLVLPLFHLGGLSILWRSAAAAGSVALQERFDAERVAAELGSGEVTMASLVPTMLHRLLDGGTRPSPKLRAVLVGGAAASPALLRRALDGGFPVLPTYGATEACSQIATVAPGDEAAGLGTVGEPLDTMEVTIVDTSGAPVAAGATGEITVAGPAVSPGYAHAPPRNGPHRTGDLGRWEGRRLVVMGRVDDLIITGGEKVAPQAVEAALSEHPEVTVAVVYGAADPEWGEVVCATVMARKGSSPSVGDLDAYARRHLRPAERPRCWLVVDELPLLPNGKVDRKAVSSRTRESGESG